MRLTPIELVNKRFPKTVGGISPSAVEEFLREVSADYEDVVAENAHLLDRVAELQRELDRYHLLESTLKDALILAQKTSDETKASARQHADQILREAHAKASAVQETAQQGLAELQQRRLRFGREFKALLEGHLADVEADLAHLRDAVYSDDDAAPRSVDEAPRLMTGTDDGAVRH